MQHALVILLVSALVPVAGAQEPSAAGAEHSFEARVNAAIDRAASALLRVQDVDGSWAKDNTRFRHGRTILATFALLHAGYDAGHPAIAHALGFLSIDKPEQRAELEMTYEVGTMILLLNALGSKYSDEVRHWCRWLVKRYEKDDGMWGYPDGIPDISNTQFAVMGLKVGERHGFKAPRYLWQGVIDAVLDMQCDDGSVRYRPGDLPRASMTHAGLMIMLFAHDSLGIKKPPREHRIAMRRAHDWAARHYSVERHPWGRGHQVGYYYYYMYGLERYGVFFHKDRIGGRDWYREGAEELLARQHYAPEAKEHGGWGKSVEDTAFGILFLRKVSFTAPSGKREKPVISNETRLASVLKGTNVPRRRPSPRTPSLREWLVTGPYECTVGEDEMLAKTHFNVERIAPVHGGAAGRQKWDRLVSKKDTIDLGEILPREAYSTYYAAVWIYPDAARDVIFWIGSDDGCRVFLNGRPVLHGDHQGWSGPDFYRLPAKLKRGRNLLLIQVGNATGLVRMRVRMTDTKGKPLEGVVTSSRRTKPKPGR